ncbi:MAG: hypothetical protein IRY89_14210 [Pseudolabrys sp.]|nr:hypothetical protein [Pseudolabrys sp.]
MGPIDTGHTCIDDGAEGGRSAAQRTLVPLAPTASRGNRKAQLAAAPFLAHLIATKEGHPQARRRRRVAAGEATAAYRATARLVPR